MDDSDYTVSPDAAASGPCLGCGMQVLAGTGFTLKHTSGGSSSPYCSRACAAQDISADIFSDGFDDGDGDLDPMDEPR